MPLTLEMPAVVNNENLARVDAPRKNTTSLRQLVVLHLSKNTQRAAAVHPSMFRQMFAGQKR